MLCDYAVLVNCAFCNMRQVDFLLMKLAGQGVPAMLLHNVVYGLLLLGHSLSEKAFNWGTACDMIFCGGVGRSGP